MNKILLVFISAFFILACNNQTEKPIVEQEHSDIYTEEKLLMDYLYKYHNNEIKHNDYWLLTFRTINICKTCRITPLDTIAKYVISDKGDNLYVLLDNQKEINNMLQYNHKVSCLCGNAKILNQYGIPQLEPLLFHIKNQKVLSVNHYDK